MASTEGRLEPNLSDIEPYIEAFRKSSDRTRSILFLIVGVAAIIICAFLNTRPDGWFRTREEKYAKSFAAASNNALPSSGTSNAAPRNGFFPALEAEDVTDAKAFAKKRGIFSSAQLQKQLEIAEGHLNDQTVITIPLLGVRFDINDLGIVAGVVLLFLSIVLASASLREHENLNLTLGVAQENGLLKPAYDLVRMGELLHFAGKGSLDMATFTKLKDFVYLLYACPAIALTLQLAYDASTLDVGNLLSELETNRIFVAEFVLWMLLMSVTVVSVKIAVMTDEAWRCWDKKCFPDPPPDPNAAGVVAEDQGAWATLRTVLIFNLLLIAAPGVTLILFPGLVITALKVSLLEALGLGAGLVAIAVICRSRGFKVPRGPQRLRVYIFANASVATIMVAVLGMANRTGNFLFIWGTGLMLVGLGALSTREIAELWPSREPSESAVSAAINDCSAAEQKTDDSEPEVQRVPTRQ